MNIKDIAELAGVSVTTVSMVINGKADGISDKTKKKVLKIVSEHNYVPYQSVRNNIDKSSLIGVWFKDKIYSNMDFFQSMIDFTNQYGLNIVFDFSNLEEDKKIRKNAIDRFVNLNVEAIIIIGEVNSNIKLPDIPCIVCSNEYHTWNNKKHAFFPIKYELIAEKFLAELKKTYHKKVILVANEECYFTKTMIDTCIKHDLDITPLYYGSQLNMEEIKLNIELGVTAIICDTSNIAVSIKEYLVKNYYHVPQNVSVLSILENKLHKSISGVSINYSILAKTFLEYIMSKLNNTTNPTIEAGFYDLLYYYNIGQTLSVSRDEMKQVKIAICGSLHVDINLYVQSHPREGGVINSKSIGNEVGGKCSNHSIAAARLGARVDGIGTIGNDMEGKKIISLLNQYGINTKYIKEIDGIGTGKAYITIVDNGRNSIIYYMGANGIERTTLVDDISSSVENADFCIVDNEIPNHIVSVFLDISKKFNKNTILKCTEPNNLENIELRNVDYIILSREELSSETEKENKRAKFLLDNGVLNVIILDNNNCSCTILSKNSKLEMGVSSFYLKNETGMSAAFISTFAVCLSEKHSLKDSVKKALIASIIVGESDLVINAYPDKRQIEAKALNTSIHIN